MAIVHAVAVGSSRKSVGEVTFSRRYGRTIMSKRIWENSSKTAAQVAQRSDFAKVVAFCKFLPSVYKSIIKRGATSSSYNVFTKERYDQLLTAANIFFSGQPEKQIPGFAVTTYINSVTHVGKSPAVGVAPVTSNLTLNTTTKVVSGEVLITNYPTKVELLVVAGSASERVLVQVIPNAITVTSDGMMARLTISADLSSYTDYTIAAGVVAAIPFVDGVPVEVMAPHAPNE